MVKLLGMKKKRKVDANVQLEFFWDKNTRGDKIIPFCTFFTNIKGERDFAENNGANGRNKGGSS